MNRLMIVTAIAGASCAIAVPAVAGLAGNPSFSHRLPVRVPSQAQLVHFDDSGKVVGVASQSRLTEPGDDRGTDIGVARSSRAPEPGDDRGGDQTSTTSGPGEPEPGDDNGHDATTQANSNRGPGGPGNGSPSVTRSPEPGDDNGRDTSSGPTSTDDGPGHGGSSTSSSGDQRHGG
jgi:hypothetical protein